MKLRKVLYMTGLLSLGVMGFGMLHAEAAAADTITWDCVCGKKANTSKFCGECGAKRPEAWDCRCGKKGITARFCTECGIPRPSTYKAATAKKDGAATEPAVDSRIAKGLPEMCMVDGPGMMNVNYWKHEALNGGWGAPEGDIALNIKGFDYELGIYKAGEPDNHRWLKDRFYFNGQQKSPDREKRYDLELNGEPKVTDAEGNPLVALKAMWHEGRSIYMLLKYPDKDEVVKRELRKFKDIAE